MRCDNRDPAELAPDGGSRSCHQFQFALLFCGGDRVADNGRSKSALRADPQSFAIYIAAGFSHVLSQHIEALQGASLRRDESQDNKLVLRNIFERIKGPGAGIVVFQQETLSLDRAEQAGADGLVSSC